MPKADLKTTYQCRECGHVPANWEGKCSRCGEWGSIEGHTESSSHALRRLVSHSSAPARTAAIELSEIPAGRAVRTPTGVGEFDRVLGGGIVSGSTMLLAGDPGIGKSTLLLQAAASVARTGATVLYSSGEESGDQIRLRAQRLGIEGKGVFLLSTGDTAEIAAQVAALKPSLVIVDSIQTAYSPGAEATPGVISQVRESAAHLAEVTKESGSALILAGHVTKDGSIAGPKVLEHMVDVVLQMEGEMGGWLRLLRGIKNRFGATDEIGVFEMRGEGLIEVLDPSRSFLAQRQAGQSGSAVATLIEGTRPITVEIQALVTPSSSPAPRRIANGVDMSRLLLISAVLSKRLHLPLSSSDIVVSVAGGLRVREPASDLAIAMAIASSMMDRPAGPSFAFAGEIGLGGELRAVSRPLKRAAEALRLGFASCLLPEAAGEPDHSIVGPGDGAHPSIIAVRTLAEAVKHGLVPHVSGGAA